MTMHTCEKLLSAVAFGVVLTLSPLDAAVRPPRLAVRADEAAERPHGRPVAGSFDADRARRALVSRRARKTRSRADRLRASVRAHDVQGLQERRAGRARVDAREHRRAEQRVHQRRRDRVLADGAVAVPAAGAVDGSRSHGDAAHRQGDVRERARSRQRRAAPARRQPAVRPAVGDPLRQLLYGQPVQAHDDRQHEGSRRGVGRGRARFPQHVLRAGQRDDRHRRRLRHGAGQGAGDAVFRARPEIRPRHPARVPAREADRRQSAA